MKRRIIEASVLVAFFICVVSCIAFEKDCENIRDNVLRLHVIADSDSSEAQKIKLEVRDALLKESKELFYGNGNISEAQQKLGENLSLMQQTAERVLREKGYTYSARVEIAECYFPTRQYGDITLPAGKYNALRVVLGEGEGQNWWCVMFPPMCLPAASKNKTELRDILDERSLEIVTEKEKYEIRLWIVEKWYSFLSSISDK